MAGSKDIYIGEMLEEVVENISALQSSMSNDFTKLINGFEESASKQIAAMSNIEKNLAQVLANTGLTKKQKVYSGSELTAVTLNSSKWTNYFEKHGLLSITDNVIQVSAIGGKTSNKIIIFDYDLSDVKELVCTVRSKNAIGLTAQPSAKLSIDNTEVFFKSISFNQTTASETIVNVDSFSGKKPIIIDLNMNWTGDDSAYGIIFTMVLKDYEGNLIELESPVPVESILSYANNCITATGTAYGYSEFDLSSLNAAQYSDIFFRGTGGEIEVYDSDYNFVGESANGGVNLVNLTTNKAILFYSFKEAGIISSIAVRYF